MSKTIGDPQTPLNLCLPFLAKAYGAANIKATGMASVRFVPMGSIKLSCKSVTFHHFMLNANPNLLLVQF
jgi:hypothetical protein